jgi:hypothetical protein
MRFARDEARARAVNLEQRAVAVGFDLEEPSAIVESRSAALQDERRRLRACGGHDEVYSIKESASRQMPREG